MNSSVALIQLLGRMMLMRVRIVLVFVALGVLAPPALSPALGAGPIQSAPVQSAPVLSADDTGPCAPVASGGVDYVVCRFDPALSDLRLFLDDAHGAPYGHFAAVQARLSEAGERLVFAMNAGMYHEDRSPVGLYVENGQEQSPLSTKSGYGNFHLQPNGVFFLTDEGVAGVQDTKTFEQTGARVRAATQSGPMLVIDDEIHPRFLPDSTSLKRRNGVGVTAEGEVIFALADTPVRFYDFAVFFRDALAAPNALYLDGTISRLYAPNLPRNDPGAPMGPIVGVTAPNQ